MEESISSSAVNAYLTRLSEGSKHLIAYACERIAPAARINIETMIILDIHGPLSTLPSIKLTTFKYYSVAARDVANYLCGREMKNANDFDWLAQMRYYWDYDDIGGEAL